MVLEASARGRGFVFEPDKCLKCCCVLYYIFTVMRTFPTCPKYHKTQYATINGDSVNVNDYINIQSSNDRLKCCHGHELILVNGEINRPHFRHKNPGDTRGRPMSNWHIKWQGFFPITEVEFKKKGTQLQDRRADVFIEKCSLVVEIQHSQIDKANVACRKSDYAVNGMETVWVVDGNTKDVVLEELSNGIFLIIFHERWKYRSFCGSYKHVLLDIDDKIFKIPVDEVCNDMISVKEYIPTDAVVDSLLTNFPEMWNMWSEDREVFPTLTRIQKGAGNGKTYGIWKSICSNPDKELFIITTKTHSAKHTIYAELNEQVRREETHIIENMEKVWYGEKGNQLLVTYIHKESRRECVVIIGTIDSFGWGLATSNKKTCDFMKGLWETVIESGCDKVNPISGRMTYAGRSLKLNRKAQLWIDEAQDLDVDYMRAIVRMMLETKMDVMIVGDKLQSLKHAENFISSTETDGLPNIRIVNEKPINVNRRIKIRNMAGKINSLVDFHKYKVPAISMEAENSLEDRATEGLEVMESEKITKFDEGKEKLTNYVTIVLAYVKKEVQKHGYKANNFLFVFPVLLGNVVATELETRLNEYWIKECHDDTDKYTQYAVLHKSEDGRPIDITKSENASRIMSIDAAKGGQREVVFVLGCTEQTLKLRSRSSVVDVVYESFLHVALTRAQHKTYFALVKNNDEIHRRFGNCGYVEYKPIINTSFRVSRIMETVCSEKIVACMEKNGVHGLKGDSSQEMTPTIDWEYHCIRHAVYLNYSMFAIIKNSKACSNYDRSQLKVVLDQLSRLDVRRTKADKFDKVMKAWEDPDTVFEYFPVCVLSYKTTYADLSNILTKTILDIQKQLRGNTHLIADFSPFQATVLHYMLDLYMNRSRYSISTTTIYNICDYFNNKTDLNVSALIEESEKIKYITDTVLTDISETARGTVHWNMELYVRLDGNMKASDIAINYHPPLIGHDDKTVYHLEYVTDLNQLNYWEVMVRVLLTRFLLANPKGNEREKNNVTKFVGKSIKTYIFVLKQNRYVRIDWDWDATVACEIIGVFKAAIMNTLVVHHEPIRQFYNQMKKNKKVWSDKHDSPMAYVADQFSHVKYVSELFGDLNRQYLDGHKDVVQVLLNDKNAFSAELDKRADRMCDAFFRPLSKVQNDEEW